MQRTTAHGETGLSTQERHIIGNATEDPFGGSGTTLIACERHQRKARLIEIDPGYADVICQRWQQFRGKQAVLEGDGRTFAQMARQRKSQAA